MRISDGTLEATRQRIVNWLTRKGYGENAEDVAQEFVCEVLRQPRTEQFIIDHAEEVVKGTLPSVIKRRVQSKAHRMISRFLRIEDTDARFMSDATADREKQQLSASWGAEELVAREPWLGSVLEAHRLGCSTQNEVCKHLHMKERTYYAKLRRTRESHHHWE